MSKLPELIEELCPDGVEYKPLGKVAEYVKDRRASDGLEAAKFVGVDNLLPNFQGVDVPTYGPNTARVTAFQEGDILIGNIRPYLKKIWLANYGGGCSGDVLALRITERFSSLLDTAFLYRVLASDSFFDFNMKHARGGKMPRGDKQMILRYEIPIPPMEVQQEIVRVLDAFTGLEQSLVAELELRKKQLTHLRREAVASSQLESDKKLLLGEAESQGLVAIGRGKVISKKDIAKIPGDYPVYSSSGAGKGEFGRYGQYMFDDERITWSVDGGGRLFYRPKHRYSVTNVSGWMTVDTSVLRTKYLYYVLLSQWEEEHFDYTRKAHPSVIRNVYEFSIPPLETQDKVISILNAFEFLIESLEQEINLRRKQYEFYRDELLTFKSLEV